MKFSLICFTTLVVASSAASLDGNVMGKIFGMMDDMKTKIVRDGKAEQAAYEEYFEWCDDASKNKQFEIKTMTAKVEELTATIDKATGDAEASASRVEELAGSISTAEEDLKDAAEIRTKEKSEFKAEELDMVDTVDKLNKVEVMLKKISHHGAALAQIDSSSFNMLVKSMGDVMDAASISTQDKRELLALVQSKQGSDDEALAAPAAAAYSSHTGAILELITDMKEKAEGELDGLRKKEKESEANYQMLKMSLEDQMEADKHEMSDEKQSKADAEGEKARAEGDLSNTQKALDEANKVLEDMRAGCMQTAADHEATVKAREEELAVLAKARKILEDTVGGAVKQSYSMVQVESQIRTHTDLVKSEVLTLVRRLAKKHHSTALSQLASRVASVIKYGTSSGDPFGKVKGLITDLIAKLQKEAEEEASEKAYCDEQMSKTGSKKDELDNAVAKLTAKIDKAAADSAQLKEEVKELQKDLAALAKTQAEMDKVRADEKAAYEEASSDLKLGLEGVRKALKVLRDYYGNSAAAMVQTDDEFSSAMSQPAMPEKHSAQSGAGGNIINMLEVAESDFAKDLAEEEKTESDSVDEYETTSEDNKMTKMTQEQDVKYKTAEFKGLDKTISELSGDRETENTELAAVNEYWAKIKERCVAKPESYEERKARREAEINGLKEALDVLKNEAAFVQRKRHMRGGHLSM